MPPPSPEQVAATLLLIKAQEAAREDAARQIEALARTAVQGFDGWYDTAAITSWATRLASLVEAVQRSLARSTDSYMGRASTLLTGRRQRPVGAVDVTSLRSGVSHAGAYGRVADTFRYQAWRLEQPTQPVALTEAGDTKPTKALVAPEQAALNRAAAVADMDVQLVVRKQAQAFLQQQPKVLGYRRVIHPELSKGGTCGLCIVASDRFYRAADLMPIHAHCNCVPLPVYSGKDLGSVINAADLDRLYDEAGDTSAEKLKRTRYQITEHGELGPLLNPKGVDVRSPADVKRDERT